MKPYLYSLTLCFLVFQLTAQPVENKSTLTVDQIMQGSKFVGSLPSNISWGEDNETIYFQWNPNHELVGSTYQLNKNGGTPQKLDYEGLRNRIPNGDYNKARTHKVYAQNGDIFLYDIANQSKIQITNTVERESNPQFAGDENLIVYTKNKNLYLWYRDGGMTEQITNFKSGEKKPKRPLDAQQQWLENDQLEYFEIVKERKDRGDLRDAQRDSLKPKRPLEIYYGSKYISQIIPSPDLNFVTYRLIKSVKGKGTKVPDFVTESGYLKDLRSRVKVGTPQDKVELGIYDRVRDTAYIFDITQLEGIYDKPAFLEAYYNDTAAYNPKYKKPREVVIHQPVYSEDSRALVEIKAQDNKDRWLVILDLATGKIKQIDRQHDDAWIGGPGVREWNFWGGTKGWLDNNTVYFQSEKTGYSHLYTANITTGKIKALTKGKFEIQDVTLSHNKKYFYITSNKVSPHDKHFYKMTVKGGKLQQITTKSGNHQVTLSPDEEWLAIRYSYSNQPWELYVMPNKIGAEMKKLTNSTSDDFKKYNWRVPEIVQFKADDGVKVPARIYRPKNPVKGGPAIIFVHGAGYLQNVHNWWSSYYREYMFHNLLADNGYTVLDIDYRASAGYGRDWRTAIYQFMGGRDLQDQVDGAKFLTEEYDIDPKKIGIYGGSYGGFITLMGLFTKPGTFKSGAALRSVTDWAHYNHPYTSNILNTPVEDSIAFYKSSPIYHAAGLQDHLLILHGMIDTNVQFQDVVRLAQRLIELGKDNWEFAVFPKEGHGFREASSWADEYKRIFQLFQETLKK